MQRARAEGPGQREQREVCSRNREGPTRRAAWAALGGDPPLPSPLGRKDSLPLQSVLTDGAPATLNNS